MWWPSPAVAAILSSLVALHCEPAQAQLCGDPNASGSVTVTDAVQTLRAAAELPSACALHTCDVNGSGTVTVSDGVIILRAAARLEAQVRCPLGVSLDQSFGDHGIVTTPLGNSNDPSLPLPGGKAIVIQPDGKIVVAGGARRGFSETFAVARYNPDGTLDPEFGGSGIVTTPIGVRSDARGLALQPDGKLVVVGSANLVESTARVVAVARYDPDGTLDPSFGDAGIATTSISGYDEANAVRLQPDGKIVVAGISELGFLWARYGIDGTPDVTFGNGGTTTRSIGLGYGSANALALQPDGKLVAVGGASTTSVRSDIALARIDGTGIVDETFRPDPITLGEFSDAYAVAVQSDGMIVALGTVGTFGDGMTNFQPVVIRYRADGQLDSDFGDAGIALTTRTPLQWASAMVLDAAGRIVAAGFSFDGDHLLFALGRYAENGAVDDGFGGGAITTDLGGNAQVNAVARQADGKLVAVGSLLKQGALSLALVRYIVP